MSLSDTKYVYFSTSSPFQFRNLFRHCTSLTIPHHRSRRTVHLTNLFTVPFTSSPIVICLLPKKSFFFGKIMKSQVLRMAPCPLSKRERENLSRQVQLTKSCSVFLEQERHSFEWLLALWANSIDKIMSCVFLEQERHSFEWLLAPWKDYYADILRNTKEAMACYTKPPTGSNH
jgi:hypothetical protein